MYFITFSRKTGTNGSEIARRVAGQLGYAFYDTEAIENAAQEMGFLKDVREIDEKAPSLFQRFFSQLTEVHFDRLHSLLESLDHRPVQRLFIDLHAQHPEDNPLQLDLLVGLYPFFIVDFHGAH